MRLTKIKIATQDDRGNISDILYNEQINHVTVINTAAGNWIRGNHYHKETTQWMYLTKGYLWYWYEPYTSTHSDSIERVTRVNVGDLIMTPPWEIHTLHILEETQFIVFTKGPRGGKDYESDTFRMDKPIFNNPNFDYNEMLRRHEWELIQGV
jgi:dTDP-4-dehydrorhamnose 3,5-epimerase-like enzyme